VEPPVVSDCNVAFPFELRRLDRGAQLPVLSTEQQERIVQRTMPVESYGTFLPAPLNRWW